MVPLGVHHFLVSRRQSQTMFQKEFSLANPDCPPKPQRCVHRAGRRMDGHVSNNTSLLILDSVEKPETSLLQYDGWLSGGAAMAAHFSPPWNSCKKLDAFEQTGTFFSPELAAAFSKATHCCLPAGACGRKSPAWFPSRACITRVLLAEEGKPGSR